MQQDTGRHRGLGPLGPVWAVAWLLILAVSASYLLIGLGTSWAIEPTTLANAGGMAVGRDFIAFWSASAMALAGVPEQVYDVARLHALQVATIGVDIVEYPWLYPPTGLLLVVPLALLPYLGALALWLALPTVGLATVTGRLAQTRWAAWLMPFFPGVAQCLIMGQNGILSTLLLAGGLLQLERRPALAGAFLGLLTYKPQLALLVGPALLVGQHYRALLATVASALALAGASWIVLGTSTWQAFIAAMPEISAVAAQNAAIWPLMVTPYGALRIAGAGMNAAYAVQGLISIGVLLTVVWSWRSAAPLRLRGAILASAIPLATPYCLNYDLAVLVLPLAWLAGEARRTGWRHAAAAVFALVWLVPVIGWLLAGRTGVLPTPLVLLLLLALLCRRVLEHKRQADGARAESAGARKVLASSAPL
jgi:hypothetical protein